MPVPFAKAAASGWLDFWAIVMVDLVRFLRVLGKVASAAGRGILFGTVIAKGCPPLHVTDPGYPAIPGDTCVTAQCRLAARLSRANVEWKLLLCAWKLQTRVCPRITWHCTRAPGKASVPPPLAVIHAALQLLLGVMVALLVTEFLLYAGFLGASKAMAWCCW
jgi:hypothetical protein